MIRFSSVAVPFAASTLALPGGASLTPIQLARLVALHAEGGEHAVVSPDRPTVVAATKAFGLALAKARTSKAPAPVAYRAIALAPLTPIVEASDAHRTEVMAKGSAASPEAKAEVAKAVASVPARSCTIPLRKVGEDTPLVLTEETTALEVAQATIAILQEEIGFLEGRVQDLEHQLEGATAERNYLDDQVVGLGEALTKKATA